MLVVPQRDGSLGVQPELRNRMEYVLDPRALSRLRTSVARDAVTGAVWPGGVFFEFGSSCAPTGISLIEETPMDIRIVSFPMDTPEPNRFM